MTDDPCLTSRRASPPAPGQESYEFFLLDAAVSGARRLSPYRRWPLNSPRSLREGSSHSQPTGIGARDFLKIMF